VSTLLDRWTQEQRARLMLDVECITCLADVGETCIRMAGKPRHDNIHATRRRAYIAQQKKVNK